MSQWILKSNGKVVPRRMVRPLRVEEKHSPVEEKKRQIFEALIRRKLGNSCIHKPSEIKMSGADDEEWEEYHDDQQFQANIPDIEEAVDANGRLINQQPAYDWILNTEVQLQVENSVQTGKVKRRSIGSDGKVTGKYDDNLLLNSLVYEVEFPDGTMKEYAANIIAENMILQVDEDGFSSPLMEGIVDYEKDPSVAIDSNDKYLVTKRGQKRLRKSTQGWKLLVAWKDKSESWIPLRVMKELHPVEVAEFVRAKGIDQEVAFAWWVPHTLRKREVILSAVKSRLRKTMHKFGIEIPNSVEDAERIDRKNNNNFWQSAISLEMHNVGVAYLDGTKSWGI